MQKGFKKIAQKMFAIGLSVIITLSIAPISNAATQSSAEKLNSLGLLLSVSSEELKSTLTRDIGLTMILKALGYESDEALLYASRSPFKDTEGWSKGWASLAYHLNITAGTSSSTFTPNKALTEREFLTFLLRAIGYDTAEAYNNTAALGAKAGLISAAHTMKSSNYTKEDAANAMYNSLRATVQGEDVPLANLLIKKGLFSMKQAVDIGLKDGSFEILTTSVVNPHEIELTFSQVVDPNKFFFDIETPRGSYRISPVWDNVNTVAKLITVADLEEGTYTVTANQLQNGIIQYQKSVTVKPYSDLTVEIISSAVELKNNAYVAYTLKNRYDEMVYNRADQITATAKNMTTNKSLTTTVVKSSHGYYIDFEKLETEGAKLGDKIELNLTFNKVVTTKVLTCTSAGEIHTFTLYDPQVNNGRIERNSYNQVLNYSALSYAGAMLRLPSHASNQDGVLEQETIGDIVLTSSNSAIINVDTMRISETGEIKFTIGNAVGAVTITALNRKTKVKSEVTFAVYLEPVLKEVEIAELPLIVGAGNSVELKATGYDQFGAEINIGYINGLIVVSSDTAVVPKYSVKLRDNLFTYKGIAEGTSELSLYNASGALLLKIKVTIEEASRPQSIISVDMPKYFEADYDANYTLSYDNLVVIDQYANIYDLADKKERIKISYDEDTDNVLNLGTASFTSGSLTVKAKEVEGKGSYTFSIGDDEDSEYTVDVTTVDPEDITKYEMADIKDLVVGLLYAETIQLKGYLSSGEAVIISDSTIDVVTSSNTSLVTVSFEDNEITVEGVEGGTGGTVTISAWRDGKVIAASTVSVLPDEDEE